MHVSYCTSQGNLYDSWRFTSYIKNIEFRRTIKLKSMMLPKNDFPYVLWKYSSDEYSE